jgi:hypothetical protein
MRWVLVDRLYGFRPWERLIALKLGTLEEYRLMVRFGVRDRGPAALALEAAIQAARWLVEASSLFGQSLLVTELSGRPPRGLGPGEGLVWLVETDGPSGDSASFKAWVKKAPSEAGAPSGTLSGLWGESGSGAPHLTFSGGLTPLGGLSDPTEREALFRELNREAPSPAGRPLPGGPRP